MRIVAGMLTDAQIRVRRTGLTATDMARLSGENPYGGPIDVWQDKMRSEAEALERQASPDSRAVTGQMLEAAIAKRYVYDATPEGQELRVVQTATSYRHPTVEWALATPDRFIWSLPKTDKTSRASLLQRLKAQTTAADWLLECKLVGSRVSKHWNLDSEGGEPDCDRIPPYVYVQVQWQMFVLGYSRVDVAALLHGTTFRFFTVRRDDAYIEALVRIGQEFWEHNVVGKVPPPPDGSKSYDRYLGKTYPDAVRLLREAPEGTLELVTEYKAASKVVSEAEKVKDRLSQALKMIIRDCEGVEGPWGRVQWQKRGGSVDWDALAADAGITEDVIERYRRSGSRQLRVSLSTEELF